MKPDPKAPRAPGARPALPAVKRVDIVRLPTVAKATPARAVHSTAEAGRVARQRLTGAKQ